MKIYLAAAFSRRDELKAYRDKLVADGHTVTSSWLDCEWGSQGYASTHCPPDQRAAWVQRDLGDIDSCDTVISFTEPVGSTGGRRGGRHVEFGYALALGKRLILVGEPENLFHHHPSVIAVGSFMDVELVSC